LSVEHEDKWLDLIERFAARGAEVSVGNLMPCFVRHLLDVVEEQDVRIRGLEDGHRRLGERLAAQEKE
jgi:hypothetical protein